MNIVLAVALAVFITVMVIAFLGSVWTLTLCQFYKALQKRDKVEIFLYSTMFMPLLGCFTVGGVMLVAVVWELPGKALLM